MVANESLALRAQARKRYVAELRESDEALAAEGAAKRRSLQVLRHEPICGWCARRDGVGSEAVCGRFGHSLEGIGKEQPQSMVCCREFEADWWTRLVRWFGFRQPRMADMYGKYR